MFRYGLLSSIKRRVHGFGDGAQARAIKEREQKDDWSRLMGMMGMVAYGGYVALIVHMCFTPSGFHIMDVREWNEKRRWEEAEEERLRKQNNNKK